MKKFLRRTAVTTLILVAVAFVGTAIWGSGTLIHPQRRAIKDYHREVVAAPDKFGLKIESYTGPLSTPACCSRPRLRPARRRKAGS